MKINFWYLPDNILPAPAIKIPKSKLAVFFRYDHFETKHTAYTKDITIGGLSYRFTHKSKVLVDFQNDDIGDNKNHYMAEIALEVHF